MNAHQMQSGSLTTNKFTLPVVYNAVFTDLADHVHIYIEGDGRPYERPGKPTSNPTSEQLLALRLMAKDNQPAIYLNRPCYGMTELPPNCDVKYWTSHRYSEDVVQSMESALNELKKGFPSRTFTLIGHSGGGTLAILLASKRKDVRAVISISANVDHLAWSKANHYPVLSGSLNAIDVLPLPSSVKMVNLYGEQDKQVQPVLIINGLSKQKSALNKRYPTFSHSCCWEQIWPDVLREFGFDESPLTNNK